MNENQLKFLWDNYANNKGFSNYDEFKSLMGNDANRKLFFDDSNKELGFTDYNEFETVLGVKKKGATTQGSGQPSQQPGKPSAPSFGQKLTEKITKSAIEVPYRAEEKPVKEKEQPKPQSKYFEIDVTEKPDGTRTPVMESPVEVAKKESAAKGIKRLETKAADDQFNRNVLEKEVFQMPTRGESEEYASDITKDYLQYVKSVDPNKGEYYEAKYNQLKSKSKKDRISEDESFLRQIELEAIDKAYDSNYARLDLLARNIDELEKIAVTPSDRSRLNYMYGEYANIKNNIKGIAATYSQNALQYGKIAGEESQIEEGKRKRFEAIQAGDGKTVEFFKKLGDASVDLALSPYKVAKVFGDLTGDTDYDVFDKMYDSVMGAERTLEEDFGAPLPAGKRMSDLPLSARLAVIGGNAIGSAGVLALGGAAGGATKIGRLASQFGTGFLTAEGNYYQEALDAGMSPQDAAWAGTYLAAQQSALELMIPDFKYLEAGAARASIWQGFKSGIGKGLPAKEALKTSVQGILRAAPGSIGSYGKVGTKEAGEEVISQGAEDVTKEAINLIGEREYFNDTFNPEAYTDAILGGFIAGPGMSAVFSRPTPKSPVQEEVMREIVERRPHEKMKGTASDKISGVDLTDIDDAVKIYDAMSSHSGWNVMSREEQNHALALAQQAEVMKKEQERMKELRIPDERKDAEIKRLEDEVNEMFSIQMEQEKQKAKDAKLKAIEDEFNKSMEGEEFPVQEDERDQEIVELQKQREERGINELDTFLSDMKPMVPFAVERTEQGLPVAQSVKQAASNYLYKKYKELTDMKSDPNRMMTRGQIASVQKQLEQDIRTLEGTAETKTETRDQENIQGIPSQVREGQEPVAAKPVEVPSAEAPEAGRVLQAQEEVTPTEKIKSNWNYEGEGDAFASNKESREGKSSYVTRILDTIGVGKSYNRAKQRGELDTESPLTYKGDKESISAIDGNGNKVGVIELQSDGGVQHLAVAPEFSRKGVATELIKQIEQKGAKVRFEKSKLISPDAAKLFNKLQSLKDQETAPKVTPEVTAEPVVKPSRRERLAKMFETSEGEIAAEKVASFLGEANIGVEVLDPKSFEEKGKQRNFEGSADGIFLVDNNTGKIYLNKERIKGAEGKTIAFHEGIHPVVNIIRNTNPKLYRAIVDGLKAEAVKNAGVAEAAEAVASSKYYQEQGPSAIEDETVVETMARVAAGDIDIDTFEPSFREKFIEFMNKLAKMLGLKPIAVNSPRMEVKRLADQLSKALNEGGKISDIVGKKNLGKFQNDLVQPRITAEEVLSKSERGDKKVVEVADAFEKAVDDILDPQSDPNSRITRFLQDAYEDLRYFLAEYQGDTGLDWYTNKVKEFNLKLENASDIAIQNGEMSEENSLRNPDNMDLFKVVLALSSIGVNPRENVKAAFAIWKTFNQETKTFSKYQPGQVSLRTNISDGKGGYLAPSGLIVKDTKNYLDLKQKNGKIVRVQKSDLAKEISVTYIDSNGKEKTQDLRLVKSNRANTVFRKGPSIITIKNDSILDSSEISDGIQGKGWTTKGNVVAINLSRVESLLADQPNLKSAIDWINEKHPINELRKYNAGVPDVEGGKGKINPKGERIGSYIIGEKLGAFHQNVAGTPTELTMDLWWSRTWNRYMGTLLGVDKDGQPIIQETPRTDNERNVMREAAKTMADSLGLEVHELQAALWYMEQQLYKRMGAAVESYSFVDGIDQLLLKYGKSKEEIQPERYGIDSTEADKRRTDAAARAADILYGAGSKTGKTKPVGQASKGIKRGSNLVKDTYYESGLTEDKNDYIFFHVSSAPEASIRKGIDSTKYTSLRTAREEKGLQYGVASYYTRPEDGERMVGGEKYAVRVPKAKVYPIDSDPLGYGEKAEAKIPQGTPFRGEAVKREIADMAKKNGYEMIVGEWSYSRTGKPAGELPEFRADALVPLKPTKENPNSFTSNAEKGMERIPFPSQQSEQAKQELESIASEVRDIMSSKKKFSSKEYQLADSVYMSGQVTENKYEDNEFKRDITPEEYDMMTKVLPKSMQADAARVRGLLFGKKGQASIGIPRGVKQFSDNVSGTIDRIKEATGEDGATLNLDGSTYEDGGLVVPAGSINVAQDDVSAEGLFEFLKDNEGNISSDIFKIGLYRFPDRPEVSYDLNIVIPREYRDVALKFGELAGQESLFDLDTFENIKTGSDGKNPRKFTAQELAEIAKDLSEGRLPKIVSKQGQPSMVKRTSAEVQRLMEDSMDSVDETIADGVDAQTAVEDNITSQDWYSELTPKQKEQFDEIIKDEFGVTPKAPVAKPTGVKATIANIIDNYYKLKDGDRSARAAINEILGQDPKLKYIYDNISKINKQLQDAGVITDKTDGCP